jgi:hypothetical protein
VKRAAALLALALVAAPALTGCFNGPRATTTVQATQNTGNGVEATQGAIHIENLTVVLGPEGSGTATVLTRLTNTGPVPDRLTFASVDGKGATITGDSIELLPGASVSVGYASDVFINSYDFAAVSTYVPVQLGFEEAGLLTVNVLTVPPAGIYAGIAPNPPTTS